MSDRDRLVKHEETGEAGTARATGPTSGDNDGRATTRTSVAMIRRQFGSASATREWLSDYGHTFVRGSNLSMSNVNVAARPYDVYSVHDNTQGVAAEIDKLGEDGRQWVREYGAISKYVAEQEAHDRNEANRPETRPGVF